MEQLKIKDISVLIHKLKNSGMSLEEISELPIYLGNDDELNGIHNGWCVDFVDKNNKDENTQYLVSMIEENYATSDLKDKGILLS